MWARIENGTVVELVSVNPAGRYHPSLLWVDCTGVPNIALGWIYTGADFTAPSAPPPAPPPTQISPLEFMARLTPAETTAISTAALGNAALLMWLVQASAAQYIDLTDPRTKEGLDALVAAGLLTADRAAAVLTP